MTGVKHDQPRWKTTKLDWAIVSGMDNTALTAALRVLTSRQQSILLAFMEQLKWKTRWDNLTISQDDLDALQAELSLAIMDGDNVCSQVEECIEVSPTIISILEALEDLQDQIDDIEDGGIDDNVYPPYPSPGSAAMCGSANYVITALRNWIVTLEDAPNNYLTIFDALFAFLAGDFGVVYEFLDSVLVAIFGGGYTSVLPTFDEFEPDMIAYLNCTDANKDEFSAWVREDISAEIADFIDCLAYSAWDRFVAIGSGDLTHVCQVCGEWCVEALGGAGLNTWSIVTYAPVTCTAFYSGDEVQSCTASSNIQFAVELPILAGNVVETVACKIRSTNITGDSPINLDVLDRDGSVVWSAEQDIPIGSGLTTAFCFYPGIELPQGGSIVLWVHAPSANYSYANLVNVQVRGDGLSPYTPNCVSSYGCGWVSNQFDSNGLGTIWQAVAASKQNTTWNGSKWIPGTTGDLGAPCEFVCAWVTEIESNGDFDATTLTGIEVHLNPAMNMDRNEYEFYVNDVLVTAPGATSTSSVVSWTGNEVGATDIKIKFLETICGSCATCAIERVILRGEGTKPSQFP